MKPDKLTDIMLKYWLPMVLAGYLAVFAVHAYSARGTVYGDGRYYFAWVRTLVVGRDIDFTDEFSHYGIIEFLTARGTPGNKFSVGPALTWMPAYTAVHALVRGDGYGWQYQLITGAFGMGLAVSGLVFIYLTLTGIFSRQAAAATVLIIAYGTNLLYYGAFDTVNSHSVSFFAVSLFLLLLRRNFLRAAGAALGLVGLTRPQDLVTGLVLPGLFGIRRLPSFLAGLLPVVAILLITWTAQFTSPLLNPYLTREGFSLADPRLTEVLFDKDFGLITVTPAVGLALIGLALSKLRLPFDRWQLMSALLVQIYLISSWSTWWQGETFGSRMFVGMLPLLSFGVAALIPSGPRSGNRTAVWLLSAAVAYHLVRFAAYALAP